MADFIKIYEENPNPKEINKVVNILNQGGLIIYPTDTVYGLGCDITNVKALERVARIKNVKLEKANFSFICHDLSNLSDYVSLLIFVPFVVDCWPSPSSHFALTVLVDHLRVSKEEGAL